MFRSKFFLLILCCWTEAAYVYVPKVEVSYRAIGEIIMDEPILGRCMVIFEENYDKEAQMTSFWHSLNGLNTTILEYLNPGFEQSFQYFPHDGKCERLTAEQWDGSGAGSGLRPSVKTPGGQLILPVRELLSLRESDLSQTGWGRPVTTFRGLRSNWFTFEVQSGDDILSVDAYWSDGRGSSTMSSNKEIPLGFVVTRLKGPHEKPDVHVVNILYFAHNEVNRQMTQPVRGVHCPDRKDPATFPDLGPYLNMAWSTENVLPEYGLVTNIDNWLDGQNRIFRSDFQVLNSPNSPVYTRVSMIVVFDQGTVYYLNSNNARGCRVAELKDEPYYPQVLMDPRDPNAWKPDVFFRGNSNFVRLTQINERGLSCDVFQAERRDWPPDAQGKITSVWEWCFANNLSRTAPEVTVSEAQLPLVSLDIYIKESPYKLGESGMPSKGQQLSYNFYNVRQMKAKYMDVLAFDISSCFESNRRSTVTFLVELTPGDRKFLMKEESDVELISIWRNALYTATQLPSLSLRISNIKMGMDDDDESPLMVQAVILDRHPDLADRSAIGLDTALANLKDVIDKRQLTIEYHDDKFFSSLTVKSGSMEILNQGQSLIALPPALFRAKAEAVRRREEKGSGSSTPLLLGLISLQVGVALGVVAVALRKWNKTKSRSDSQPSAPANAPTNTNS